MQTDWQATNRGGQACSEAALCHYLPYTSRKWGWVRRLAVCCERFAMPTISSKRLLVSLYHCYLDPSSGAAISLRAMVEALASAGFEVRVLSGPRLDFEVEQSHEDLLRAHGIDFKTYRASHLSETFHLNLFQCNGVTCGLWIPQNPRADPSHAVGNAWLSSYREILESWRPEVVLTYGGFWMTGPSLQMAQQAGAKTVFYLCNYAYNDAAFFQQVDTVVTLSHHHAAWYRQQLGLESVPIYPLMPAKRYLCDPVAGQRYVTFVNPQPHKGVYVFAKIAEVLGRTRPDIPLLVVEGRATTQRAASVLGGLNHCQVYRMANTTDPREYLQVTRIALVPSVWQESFGRVAAEAMMNGIPAIGSRRGALPEVIGDERLLIDLPDWITPETRRLPSDDEVAAWVNVIVRLWDDEDEYRRVAEQARRRSALWAADRMVDRFAAAVFG